jgi:uncharacterized membrane protein YeiH
MIYPFAGIIIGAITGSLLARQRGGKRLDMLQWGAVCAIMGGLVGLFALVFIERSMV